jgi:hypothetical protein
VAQSIREEVRQILDWAAEDGREVELEPGPEEDLSHLHDSVRPVARLPAAEWPASTPRC